jgi:hypothetical protein
MKPCKLSEQIQIYIAKAILIVPILVLWIGSRIERACRNLRPLIRIFK